MMKKWLSCLLAAAMVLGMATTAQAADTKIDKVTVAFSYDAEPASGDSIGSVRAKTDSSQYTVNYAEYMNEGDRWAVGDRPMVMVELSARDGYRFSYTSKSHFSVSGGGATFNKARIYDDGATMELQVYLKRIGGKLTGAEGLEWDGTTAYWEEIEGAKSYEVRLYRDEKSVTTVETTKTSYDFSANINREGSYTFVVRAVASYNGRAGEWSDYSEDYYVDEEDVPFLPNVGRWELGQGGWWYNYGDGSYPYSTWRNINGSWYYFNRGGYMLTGWQKLDGSWYYLAPSGAMLTGWQYINNVWYYLDDSGIMLTDWQYINGKWYYMDSSGAMYANRMTPDGHFVDASGARVY